MNNVVVFLAQFSHNFDQSCTTNGIRYALGTAACLSNGLLLVVILGTKKLRKQHSTCLVALLAVAGSLIGWTL
jgi:hypothetical protein